MRARAREVVGVRVGGWLGGQAGWVMGGQESQGRVWCGYQHGRWRAGGRLTGPRPGAPC